jgi:hypothetical protein
MLMRTFNQRLVKIILKFYFSKTTISTDAYNIKLRSALQNRVIIIYITFVFLCFLSEI